MKLTALLITTALRFLMVAIPIAPAAAQGNADPQGSVVSASYAKDLRVIMESSHAFEYSLASKPPNLTAFERDFDAAFRRQMTADEFYRRMQTAFARVFDAKQAAQLAQQIGKPVFRKREARALVAPGNVSYGSSFFTAAEADELRRIDASPAIVELRRKMPKLKEETSKVMSNWGEHFGRQMNVRAMDVLRKVNADLAAANESNSSAKIIIGRVGLPMFDQMVWVVGSSFIKIDNASRRFQSELKHQGLNDVFKPEYLVAKLSLAHSRNVLDSAEKSLETLLSEVNSAIKEREDGLAVLALPDKAQYLKTMNESIGNLYGYFVDFGESNRNVLDQYRRTLAFFDERQGKLRLVEGKILFAEDADAVLARALFAEIGKSEAQLQKLIDEKMKQDSAMMNKDKPNAAPSTGGQ